MRNATHWEALQELFATQWVFFYFSYFRLH